MRFVSVFKPRSRRTKDDPWIIAVTMPGGRRRTISGSTSRRDSEILADKLSEIAQQVRLGMESPSKLESFLSSREGLKVAAAEYHDWLYRTGRTEKHADQMYTYTLKMIGDTATAYDLRPTVVEERIAAVKGASNTRRRYIDALRAFLTWGYRDRRWTRDPIDAIAGVRVKGVRERIRRVLPLESVAKLLASSGDMETVYTVTLAAGLRAGELPHVQIDGTHIRLPAARTKNRRGAWIRIPQWLADKAQSVDWNRMQPANMTRRLRADLAKAGIDFETPEGVFDFHALRHQCGALLASSGVPVKAIQSHMRHASIRMTMDTYGHLLDVDRRAAAAAVENFCQLAAQRADESSDLCGTTVVKVMSDDHKMLGSRAENNGCDSAVIPLDHRPEPYPAQVVMRLIGASLLSNRGRRPAVGAAARLLRMHYNRALRRSLRSAAGRTGTKEASCQNR